MGIFDSICFLPPHIDVSALVGCTDCCDGTDEKTGCRNSCLDKSAALRTAARGLVDQYVAALVDKDQSIAAGHATKAQLLTQVRTIHHDILTQQAAVKVLEGGLGTCHILDPPGLRPF